MPKVTGARKTQLARRKSAAAAANQSKMSMSDEQIQNARDASRNKFRSILDEPEGKNKNQDDINGEKIATDIENTIFRLSNYQVNDEYKQTFRRLMISLKNSKTDLKSRLLSGETTGTQFAQLPLNELISPERRNSDEIIMKEAMRLSTISEIQPSDINTIKDGRDREKWGVAKSAASMDY